MNAHPARLTVFHELPKAIRDGPDRPPGGPVPCPPAVRPVTNRFSHRTQPHRCNAVALRLSAWDTGSRPLDDC